jgi:hypothetical protein
MKVDIAVHVGIGNLLRKDGKEGVLLLDPFREGKVRRFRAVRHIGIFLVGMKDKAIHIIERHSKPCMHLSGTFKPLFDEPGVNKLPDEGRGNDLDTGFTDHMFGFFADLVCGIPVNKGLTYKGVGYF